MGVLSLGKALSPILFHTFINDLNRAVKGLLIDFVNRGRADKWNLRIKFVIDKADC